MNTTRTPPNKRAAARRGTPDAPLKNYRSQSDLADIIDAIRRSLAEAGVRRIAFDYDEKSGQECAIFFSLALDGQSASFRLPARLEAVEPLLVESYRKAGRAIPRGEALRKQVAQTGWANIRDWVQAQVALLRTGMVKPQEAFFAYMLLPGALSPVTQYEAFESGLALPMPEQRGRISRIEEQR